MEGLLSFSRTPPQVWSCWTLPAFLGAARGFADMDKLAVCQQPCMCLHLPRLPACHAALAGLILPSRSFQVLHTAWDRLVSVPPGRPFRLCSRGFLDLLPDGVGVAEPLIRLAAAPLWSEPLKPLQHCTSAWKSALDHPSIVDELLAALAVELSVGWVRPISQDTNLLLANWALFWRRGAPPRLFVGSSPRLSLICVFAFCPDFRGNVCVP